MTVQASWAVDGHSLKTTDIHDGRKLTRLLDALVNFTDVDLFVNRGIKPARTLEQKDMLAYSGGIAKPLTCWK
jgi:hypothetical protein